MRPKPQHRKIEHGYCRTTYREQGATRTVELSMLTRLEYAASFAVGFSRHTDAFEAFYSTEMVKSWERVVKMAQREIVKLSAHDVSRATEEQRLARDLAAERHEREQKIAPRRTVESPQPERRVANVRDVDEAVVLEHEQKKEQKRSQGRGFGR